MHRLPSSGPPLRRVADVLLNQIVSPVDGEGCVAFSRHVELPNTQTWKDSTK